MQFPKINSKEKEKIMFSFCEWKNSFRNTTSTTLGLEICRKKRRRSFLLHVLNKTNKSFKLSRCSIRVVNDVLITWASILLHIVKQLNLKCTCTSLYYIIAMMFILSKSYILCETSPCEWNHWWAPFKNACLPCSECPKDMLPISPCELHRDTICGSISDLKIDWIVAGKTEPNWKERRKADEEMSNHEDASPDYLFHTHVKEEALLLDWMTIALFIAALGCLILFIIAACILFYHMRQWRKIEQSLSNDVEELSSRFLAKLAEVQRIDAGAFLIRSSDSLRFPGYQAQYVLLPEKNLEQQRHQQRYVMNSFQSGNVYIEEN